MPARRQLARKKREKDEGGTDRAGVGGIGWGTNPGRDGPSRAGDGPSRPAGQSAPLVGSFGLAGAPPAVMTLGAGLVSVGAITLPPVSLPHPVALSRNAPAKAARNRRVMSESPPRPQGPQLVIV